ncbi:MAG TPA: hypothetical protein VGM88_33770 [Kofleriaceae bacterium]
MSLGLGGAAMADRVVVRAHVPEARVAVVHYRDYHRRPAVRFERHEYRRGYRWAPGEWRWEGGEWTWHTGLYIRL